MMYIKYNFVCNVNKPALSPAGRRRFLDGFSRCIFSAEQEEEFSPWRPSVDDIPKGNGQLHFTALLHPDRQLREGCENPHAPALPGNARLITEGTPQSLFTYNNMIFMVIRNALYAWPGGKNLVKLRTIADDSQYSYDEDVTTMYPYMMAVRRNILMIGYPSTTTNESLEYGIYSWGQKEKNFPMTMGLNYTMSTGARFYTASNTLQLGCVRSFGEALYFSWKDASGSETDYGLDIVDYNSTPATESSWESLVFEAGDGTHDKTARSMNLTIALDAIPAGYTITPKYKINWADDWTYGDELVEENEYRMDIDKRFKSIQYGFDVTNASATSPLKFGAVKFVYDDNLAEKER